MYGKDRQWRSRCKLAVTATTEMAISSRSSLFEAGTGAYGGCTEARVAAGGAGWWPIASAGTVQA